MFCFFLICVLVSYDLICILVWYEDALGRQIYDAEVKPERTVLDVPDVSLYALFHLPELLGLASLASNLCPSCDARLGEMPYHVFVYDLAIDFCVVKHVRAWTHDAHVAFENIDELWKFVDVGLSHEIAKGKFAWVIFGSLCHVRIFVYVHGTEFVAFESLSV